MSATQARLQRGLSALQRGDLDAAEDILYQVAADPFHAPPPSLPPAIEAAFLSLKEDLTRQRAALTPPAPLLDLSGPDLSPNAPIALLDLDTHDDQSWSYTSDKTWDGDTLRETDHMRATRDAATSTFGILRDDPHTTVSEHTHALRTNELFNFTEATADGLVREVQCEREVLSITRIRETVTRPNAAPLPLPSPDDLTLYTTTSDHYERATERHGDVPSLSDLIADAPLGLLPKRAPVIDLDPTDDEDDLLNSGDDWDDDDDDDDWDDDDDDDDDEWDDEEN
jgi:hypothetical protein